MKHSSVINSNPDVVVGGADKPKVEKMAKGSTQSSGRRTLADISNIPQQPSSWSQDDGSWPSSDTIAEHIKLLQKENTALTKLLADKNRIIELGEAKLHKLRATLQKMQQQNLQLAQSNSLMLAELNSVKDKQKALKHELGCKNGLIIAKNLELEGIAETRISQANDGKKDKQSEHEDARACTVAETDNSKTHDTRIGQKLKSLIPSAQDTDVGKSTRLQIRRQFSRFKLDEPKPTNDSFEIKDDDCLPPCSLPDKNNLQEDDTNSVLLSVKKEDNEDDYKPQADRKSSLSRPSRQAAKKVQSYKEIKVNMKMRRTK